MPLPLPESESASHQCQPKTNKLVKVDAKLRVPVQRYLLAALAHQRCVAFLPFDALTLKNPKPVEYKRDPVTLGEHLKKFRLTNGLLQQEMATKLDVSPFTYLGWERDYHLPDVKNWKAIIKTLKYYPLLENISETNWVLMKRRELGLTQKSLSKLLGVDEGIYAKIENGFRCGHIQSKYGHLIELFRANSGM